MPKHILKWMKKNLAYFLDAPNPIRSTYKFISLFFKKAACISEDFQTGGTF